MTPAKLGASSSLDGSSVTFRIRSTTATRFEIWIYAEPTGVPPMSRTAMNATTDGLFELTFATADLGGSAQPIYYGYRAWGPNWPYDPSWRPGTDSGFVADVDGDGNRFNPNKLLLDPYAREISHCVQTPDHPDRAPYASGAAHRCDDTGPFAPKGIVVPPDDVGTGTRPTEPFKDDIVYEVHVRGLTKADPTVPPELRGTYAGAALRAGYLRDLGVTAVEFLPVHQTQNALNDSPDALAAHNYWGYQTMGYFAPDRRHAADQSPGGATREWKAMVKAFHDAGLKVFIDVVFNHHEEGGVDATGTVGTIYSLRGLDNHGYYEGERSFGLAACYENETGVGPNLNAAAPIVRDLVLDSLRYWTEVLGVDGFRFDLAAVLGNARAEGGFVFDRDDPANILNRAVRELPVRPPGGGAGVDLIAEPYAASMEAQDQGNFPRGWAEWNDRFRDRIRTAQNKLGFVAVTPGELATRVAGSDDLFRGNGRRPWASLNYVVCHDGFTLRDLHCYADRANDQPYPYGPSDGGRSGGEEMCWDHGGDAALQDQAIRTSLALLLLSAGVPMITGGTEMNRSQRGNNNTYNLDTVANWLDWQELKANAALFAFTQNLLHFRRAHPALRPADFFVGRPVAGSPIKDITWLRNDATETDADYFGDPDKHFLAWQIDGTPAGDPAARILVAYNGWIDAIATTLPPLPDGHGWFLALDTSSKAMDWYNAAPVGYEAAIATAQIVVDGRSCIAAIAKNLAG